MIEINEIIKIILMVTSLSLIFISLLMILLAIIDGRILITYIGGRRKVINYYAKKGFEYLRLAPIPVKLYCNYDNCSYLNIDKKIWMGVCSLTKKDANEHLNPFFKNDIHIKDDLDHLKFSLFHEMGHYYLYTQHSEWQKVQSKAKSSYLCGRRSDETYRQLPDEKMADRIAFTMMKNIK